MTDVAPAITPKQAKGYWLVFATITDSQRFAQYTAIAGPTIASYGGKVLVRGDVFEAEAVVAAVPRLAVTASAEVTSGPQVGAQVGAFTVTNLDAGESVIVRVDLRIICTDTDTSTGNVQASLTSVTSLDGAAMRLAELEVPEGQFQLVAKQLAMIAAGAQTLEGVAKAGAELAQQLALVLLVEKRPA